jgi:predicted lipoprotein
MTTAERARVERRCAPRVGYLGALLLCAVATGCATKGAGDTRRELLTSWSTGIAVEGYRSFEDDTRALDAALVDYCAEPADAGLTAARDA